MSDKNTIQAGQAPEKAKKESDSRLSRLAAAAESAYVLEAVRA
jgi:hypothetical protein